MAKQRPPEHFTHSLNLFVSWETKQALEDLARRHSRTLATTVRTALRIGIPLVQRVWEAEERKLRNPAPMSSRALEKILTESRSREAAPVHTDS
jgi:predicted DNA-binding protein